MLLVLSVLMMPIVVLIISDYVLATDVHWADTYWIQIVPWGASVFGIFLVRQFFITMPQESARRWPSSRSRSSWPRGTPSCGPRS
jgi:multiple sugar transport system permease protein